MDTLLTILSLVAVVVVLPVCLYLLLLTTLSVARAPPRQSATKRLVCLVPAHDEAAGIAATVQSLLQAPYPPERKRVLVIADNCSDDTAARARAAGADVLVRVDSARRGKGFALEAAFEHVLRDGWAEGVLVVDADTIVAPNLWRAVSSRLAAGAQAMQVTNGVRNPGAGWRPMLQAIAMAMINGVRSLGRERLGTSVGLRGTGMAFSRATLERVPHKVYGVVEDVEYGVRLGLAGIRVAFVPETWIASDAPVSATVALSQRRRWEGGRASLVRSLLPTVARAAWRTRSPLLLDLAIDLLVPPLSYPALVVLLGGVLEVSHWWLTGALSPAAPLWLFCVLALAAYVLRGVAFSGTGWAGLRALATAPAYVLWKLVVAKPWRHAVPSLKGGANAPTEWVRTARET